MKHILGIVALAIACASAAGAATVVVNPSNPNGWTSTAQQGTSGTVPVAEFTNGIGAPPLGTGSFHMKVGYSDTDPLSKVYLGTNQFSGTRLSDISSFKVWTYIQNRDQPLGQPPMINIFTDSGATTQMRNFVFYPWGSGANQNVAFNTWQEWDLMAPTARWELLSTSGPNYFGNWSWVVTRYAGAKLLTPPAADYTAGNINGTSLNIKIGAGKAQDSRYGAWWTESDGINGYVDGLTIGVSGAETTFDFEVVPEPASLLALGTGLAGLLGLRRRKS